MTFLIATVGWGQLTRFIKYYVKEDRPEEDASDTKNMALLGMLFLVVPFPVWLSLNGKPLWWVLGPIVLGLMIRAAWPKINSYYALPEHQD